MERRKLGGSTPNVNVGRASGGQRKCGSRDEKERRGSSGAQPVVGMIHLQGGVFVHQEVLFFHGEVFMGSVIIQVLILHVHEMLLNDAANLRWFDSYD